MHHWVFFPFGCLFFLLIIGFFISNMVMWRRRGWAGSGKPQNQNARYILDKRLALGEIDVDEYKKLKSVLEEEGL